MTQVRAMTLSLKVHREFGFVDGTIYKPIDAKQLGDWDTVHSMIISWLLHNIYPKLASTIKFHVNARRLWKYLEVHF